MNWTVLSIAVFFGGAALVFLLRGGRPSPSLLGPVVALAAGVSGLVAVALVAAGMPQEPVHRAWSMPWGSLSLDMDALSAVFAAPILLVVMLAAVYSRGYMARHGADPGATRRFWALYDLLAGSMLLVVTARNGMLFLLGWELMSLSSFLLVLTSGGSGQVRRAGWIYLVATHVGTAFLLVFFAIVGRGGTLDFPSMGVAGGGLASLAFVMAFAGFGTKAGFLPFHVWLPEAHPAAPSGVSAVMSGVMIKTGIYGLLRFLPVLGPPPAWWGWVLLLAGAASGVTGVLSALAQHDLKRLLAYHSVENIGIIGMGMGLGFLGLSYGMPLVALLGFTGCVLHVVNHAVFKSLLFLGAGSVITSAGTGEIDALGGLLKRMPGTGLFFLVGSAAICGLPPLNGFVSEFLLYLSSLHGIAAGPASPVPLAAAGILTAGSLALIGGLALACFSKAFGIVFLGEPRHARAAAAVGSPRSMTVPMGILALLCVLLGLAGPLLVRAVRPAVETVCAGRTVLPGLGGGGASSALWIVSAVFAGMILAASILLAARAAVLRRRNPASAPTWGCGYPAPTARMQYTSSSFADPIVRIFGPLLGTRRKVVAPQGYFPSAASLSTSTPDVYGEGIYRPLFSFFERVFSRARMIQHGRVNLYILYIVAALIALLLWKLR